MDAYDADPSHPASRNYTRLLIASAVVITLVGAALRLATVGELSYFGDEAATLRWCREPVSRILSSYGRGLTSHLHILLVKPWLAVAGASPLAAKLPSLLAGICLLPAICFATRRWLGREVALVATACAALSQPLIYFSRVARVYMLMTLLLLLTMAVFLSALRNGRRRDLVLLALLDCALLTASLHAVYVVLIQGGVLLFALLSPQRSKRPASERRTLPAVAVPLATSVVLGAAFYIAALPQIAAVRNLWTDAPMRPSMIWGSFAWNHPSLPAVFLALVALGAWSAWRRNPRVGQLLVLWTLLPPVFYVLQSPSLGDGHIARFLVPTLPAHLLLASCALDDLAALVVGRRRGWRLGAALVVAVPLMLASPQAREAAFVERLPFQPALDALTENAGPEDLLTTFGYPPFVELIQYQQELRAVPIHAVVENPTGGGGGRLLIVTIDLPRAVPRWRREFEVELIEHPRFRHRLYVLASRPRDAGPDAYLEPLRTFFLGMVEAADAGNRLHQTPYHHLQTLARTHEHLAALAELAGDDEAARRHALTCERIRRQARQAADLR